ncbi:SH3 domain-containing protein [Gracilibacillus kekensis]|uniref:L,D-peptidoglycan transpeptidase YkuD, ErfK/YbiS/YcfS/YnhG family n=1 Tax=Gracilibacillus kekensis TaxID=1027249 RepID=A0A1M7JJX2_9BACI|nr:SH3 domain-containing protein [Gracilibacillus kekensis]SHM53409.1 L,D-peptidoglycan transpeptidase YkuD, ErfK/YbiS/YcfS/YnhG family [Gracilibacillus kekensis]
MCIFSFLLIFVLNEHNASNQTWTATPNELNKTNELEKDLPTKRINSPHKETKKTSDDNLSIAQEKDEENELLAVYHEEYNANDFKYMYVHVESLNMRIGPGTQYEVAGVLTENQKIAAETGTGQDGWVQIKTKDTVAYVNKSYLKDIPIKKETVPVANESKNSTDKSTVTETKKETKSKEPVKKKPKTPSNDAMMLSTVDQNNQLILVTSKGYNSIHAKIQTFERDSNGHWKRVLNTNGYIGKNGFSGNKVEGDGKSPTGKYTIGTSFGRSGNPGTKLPFRAINSDDVWVDDPNSSLYNSWQSKSDTEGQWKSAENMDISAYTYGFVINYNTNKTPGKGSAIFFHVANNYTLGCTGVSQSNMINILKWIDPNKKPVIIQTPESELSNY